MIQTDDPTEEGADMKRAWKARPARGQLALMGLAALSILSGCNASRPAVARSLSSTPRTPAISTSPTNFTTSTAAQATVTTTTPTSVVRPDRSIKLYGDCQMPTFEPTEIVLTCADHGTRLQGLRWTVWTQTHARAIGTTVYNDCTPDCAEGTFHKIFNTQVEVTRPVPGATGQLVWSMIYFNPQPPGYQTGPFHGGPEPLPIRPD